MSPRRQRGADGTGVGAKLLRDGLPFDNDIAPTAVLVRILIDVLADPGDAHRARTAARTAEGVFEASVRRHPGSHTIACRKGCAHCCTNFVAATIPEVLALAHRVHANWPEARADIYRRLDVARLHPADFARAYRTTLRAPCPVLGPSGACTAYEGRPIACRGYASLDLDACIRALRNNEVQIPNTKQRVLFRSRCSMALWAALKASGLSHASYDLHHAVALAVSLPDAEQRWLNGEDVFAGVQTDVSRPPEFEGFVDTLIAHAQA